MPTSLGGIKETEWLPSDTTMQILIDWGSHDKRSQSPQTLDCLPGG